MTIHVKTVSSLVIILVQFCWISQSLAKVSSITAGLSYLQSTQSTDGYWGDAAEVGYNTIIDTAIAADTLKSLGETGSSYTLALQWLNGAATSNNDYLAAKIIAISNGGLDSTTSLNSLLLSRNSDGGWGADIGFESDIKRTTLALLALKSANYTDIIVINGAITYLINNQNTEGGWAFRQAQGDETYESNVYMTALVLDVLSQFKTTYSLQTPINNAVAYLIANQNTDGGFGSSTGSTSSGSGQAQSTVYETALAFEALVSSGQSAALPLQNAINYLTTAQSANGSWNDDPYSTALALRALVKTTSLSSPPTTGTVSGTAVDAETGLPLGGVTARAVGSQQSAVTTNTGQFTLSNVPAGTLEISFALSGYAPYSSTAAVTAGSTVNLGSVALSAVPATGTIRGTITDAATGGPNAGVVITVTGASTWTATTSADGSYTISGVTVTASKSGYQTVSGCGSIAAGEVLLFSPSLGTEPPPTSTGTLQGTVVDSSGNFIQGATVTLAPTPSGTSTTSATSASGAFSFTDLSPGSYALSVSALGYIDQTYTVTIFSGTSADIGTVSLALAPTTGTIQGAVTDEGSGNPLPGATITVSGGGTWTAGTDINGYYQIAGVIPGTATITASKAGYYTVTATGPITAGGTLIFSPALSAVSSPVTINNLSVSPSDIAFSNPAPTAGDTISITCTVHNEGSKDVNNVLVYFLDGEPFKGGSVFGQATIPTIPAGGSAAASSEWSFDTVSTHSIYVVADPLSAVEEMDETDNRAYMNITVATPADLSISSADITISPSAPSPGEVMTITATARNRGETAESNVTVDLYDGNPAAGGVLIGRGTVSSIQPGGESSVQVSGSLAEGLHTLYAVIDKDNSVAETDETNNTAVKFVNVGAGSDLAVSTSDISFSPLNPKEGETVNVSSRINNIGPGTARNVAVRFYLGDPASGGTQIGAETTLPEIPAGGTVETSVLFNSAGHAGNNNIYVSVDPQNNIAELSEANNKAYGTLKVAASQGPDFTLSAPGISFAPAGPLQGDLVTFSAVIKNAGNKAGTNIEVQFSIYDPATGSSVVIGSRTVTSLAAGASATVQVIWFAPDPGEYKLAVEIDPDNGIPEMNETNNTAETSATVKPVQGIDLIATTIDRSAVVVNKQTRSISGNLSVTVKNTGTWDTLQPFVITAFEDRNNNQTFDPGTDGIFGQMTYSGNLAAGTTDTVTIAISGTTLYQDSPVYLITDSGNAITEIKETNNIDCLPFMNACRNSDVDNAMRSGASWLIDHQVNVDTQGTMKAWPGSGYALYYNALAVNDYKRTGKTMGTKYENVLNKLIQMQAPDGSWDESILNTAYAVMSLIASGVNPGSSLITDAIEWLIRVQGSDGSWSATSYPAQSTGLALMAIMKAGFSKDEPYVQKAVQWLTANQNIDGYWGHYPGESSSVWSGPYPAIGLALATSPTDARVQSAKKWYDAQKYYFQGRLSAFWLQMMLEIEPNHSSITSTANALLNEQNSDGGWKEWSTFPLSNFRTTGDTLEVLGRLGFSGSKIDKGVLWIENHINSLSEGFDEQKNVMVTSWAMNALQSANISDSANVNAISKGRKAFVEFQISDGSWAQIPIATGGWVDITAEALFALKYSPSISSAEQTAANKAVNYLIYSQKNDGGWPQSIGNSLSHVPSTESVLKSLLQSGLTSTNSAVSKGLSYLNSKQNQDGGFGDTGSTAQAAIVYKLAGANYLSRLTQTVVWLKANQNPDGGWGSKLGYTSTTGSTSWALIALSYGGETGIEVAKGVSWLLAAQNQDNGWGQVMGVPMSYDNSTALAVWALSLSRFALGFHLDLTLDKTSYCPNDLVRITAIPDKPVQDISLTGSVTLQEGTSYAMNFTNTETSFVYEFTVPSGALPGTATVSVTGTAIYGYGVATKSFIVKNCSSVLPDLSVSREDISATVSDTRNPDERLISALIRNQGDRDAVNVAVNFYKGAPSTGNLIATQAIPNIGSHGFAAVSVMVTIDEDTTLYVIVDPYNSIAETDENNNTAAIALTKTVPDLSASPADISVITPVIEGQSAKISAVIHNIGNSGASDVAVSFYDGDPASGGTLIGSVTKAYIAVGATGYAEALWNTFGQSGRNFIHVAIDPDDAIRESNENNNATLLSVDVASPAKPDLAVTSTDIAFSNLNPKEGDPLRITATRHNLGVQTGNIVAALYDGDPASGGKLISSGTISQIIPFGGSMALDFDVNTIGLNGNHRFDVVIDPENNIDEINETNNTAWDELTIGPSELSLTVSIDKQGYAADEDLAITVTLINQKAVDRSGTVEVRIIDSAGNVVSTVASQSLLLGANQTGIMNFTWNTRTTLYGDYMVYIYFAEGGNATAKATASFSIAAAMGISSKVSSDKMRYEVNQTVAIRSSITSLSYNYIFENLSAKINVSGQGAVAGGPLLEETKAVQILSPGQFTEFKVYWNTANNTPGNYAANLTITSATGEILSTSQTAFEILSTSQTGSGLKGSIVASLNQVYQGRDESLSYSVSNLGNENISGVTLKVLIVDPETQEVKTEFSDQRSVVRGETISQIQPVSTINLAPRTYLAILQAEVGGTSKTLASTTFEVVSGLEIKQSVSDYGRVLVWINDGCGKDREESGVKRQESCIRRDLVEKALDEIGVTYLTVTDKKKFQTELRNGFHTDYLILGDFDPIEDGYVSELRERLYSGKGLVSSLWRTQRIDDAFGIKSISQLPGKDYPVEIADGGLLPGQILISDEKAAKIDASVADQNILAWMSETTKKGINKYPAIITNEYGNGKALFYAFDLGLSVKEENYSRIMGILKASLNYTHRLRDAEVYMPYDSVPVRTEIMSIGGAFDLKIKESYPTDIKLFDQSTMTLITENPWTKEINFNADETKEVYLLALMPDAKGAYKLSTDISYSEAGAYKSYLCLSTEIKVEIDSYGLISDILYKLGVMRALVTGSGLESSKVEQAERYIESVRDRIIYTQEEAERSVHDMLKAIDALSAIKSIDIKEIRLDMGRLLGVYGERWYIDL